MKNSTQKIALFLFSILFFSCEEVVDIDLNNAEPKLVIDAIIKWQKGTTGENQTIKLSLTNDFYTNEILPASGAIVKVINSSGTEFDFIEIVPNSGDYNCTNFMPIIDETYSLFIQFEGQIYTASSKLFATPEIINVSQETVQGFGGEEEIQIKYFYQDNASEDNFYLLSVKNPNKQIPEFGAVSDEFFQGNIMFGFYGSDETEPGITLELGVQGISVGYYNYMNKLITIAGSGSGNPFATPPATIRGNIVNQNNADDFPLGYFFLSEIDVVEYEVQ
jgi:hypothetical protein